MRSLSLEMENRIPALVQADVNRRNGGFSSPRIAATAWTYRCSAVIATALASGCGVLWASAQAIEAMRIGAVLPTCRKRAPVGDGSAIASSQARALAGGNDPATP
jgi:hypothetical protein